MSKHRRAQITLLPVSPLLMTESEDEFDRIRDAFDEELKLRGIVEQMYVTDIAYLVWEILRLRRCKAAIINSALHPALKVILLQLLRKPGEHSYEVDKKAQSLVEAWSSNPAVRSQVRNYSAILNSTFKSVMRKPLEGWVRTSSSSKGYWRRWNRVATGHYVASPIIAAVLRDSCARAATGSSTAKSLRWKNAPARRHRQ